VRQFRRSIALWGGPLLITVLALNHMWRAQSVDQSSWKGGGFGMFASVDSETARTVRAWIVGPGAEQERVDLGPVATHAYEALVVPTEENLRRIARALLRTHVDARSVHVEVRRARFDGERDRLSLPLLRAVDVERQPG
jgi:hypothetical protein